MALTPVVPGDGPTLQDLVEDTWNLIAVGIENGFVWIKDPTVEYLQAWAFTTDPAPSDLDEGVALDMPGQAINATAAIDIYIYPIGKPGRIRTDV